MITSTVTINGKLYGLGIRGFTTREDTEEEDAVN